MFGKIYKIKISYFGMILRDKRGQNRTFLPGLIIGVILVIIFVIGVWSIYSFSVGHFSGFDYMEGLDTSISENFKLKKELSGVDPLNRFLFLVGNTLDIVVGKVPGFLNERVGLMSAGVIVIAMWFLFLITFGDIISVFGTFRESVSWMIAILLTVIVANFGGIGSILKFLILLFVPFLGPAAVFVGIGTAVAAFLIVNLGISTWGPWIMRRRMMQEASKTAIESEKGGQDVASVIKGMKHIGDALKSS